MSASALSLFVFGIYLLIIGAGYILIPNAILPLFKLPKTSEPWIRVVGTVVAVIGFYYLIAAENELTIFFIATVFARFAVLVVFTLLVIARKAAPSLIAFGLVDAAGALWTWLVL